MYQDSDRLWINHNGEELIYDLDKPLDQTNWNEICYKSQADGTFQIHVNRVLLKSEKYENGMVGYELQSPILLGASSKLDEGKHRFFGEIADFNIWSENTEDTWTKVVDWKAAKITVGPFEAHVSFVIRNVTNTDQKEKVWVSRTVKKFDAGFLDCEHLGGKPVFSYDIDTLRKWDKTGVCDYFWLPVVYRRGSWWREDLNEEVDKVIQYLSNSPI